MSRTLLVHLMAGDPLAQRLASVWSLVERVQDADGKLDRNATARSWAARSGCGLAIVMHYWPVLVDNGLCRDDGTLDEVAHGVLVAEARRKLGMPGRAAGQER